MPLCPVRLPTRYRLLKSQRNAACSRANAMLICPLAGVAPLKKQRSTASHKGQHCANPLIAKQR